MCYDKFIIRFSDVRGQKGGKIMKKYECAVCGYIYEPEMGDPDNEIAEGTPFEEIPEDWVCPVCGVTKDHFTEL